MADEYKLAARLFTLLERVDAGAPLRLKDIGEEFGINRAAATRYRNFIAERRTLVAAYEGRTKVWYALPEEPANVHTAASLQFAVHALAEFEGTEHFEELRRIARQHRLALGDVEHLQLERLIRNFQVRGRARSLNAERGKWLRKLLLALHKRKVCRIEYQGLNGFVGTHEIEPWGMLMHRDRLLCFAGKRGTKQAHPARRMYLLDGVRRVQTTRLRFPEPASSQLDYGRIFEDSFGIYCDMPGEAQEVHLRVWGPAAMDLRQRSLHPSQQTSEGEKGSLNVRWRVVICPELVAYVQGLMPGVEVISPPELANAVNNGVRAWLAGSYSSTSSLDVLLNDPSTSPSS